MQTQKQLITPGWHKDLPEDEYHSSNGISSTTLKNYLSMAPNEALYKRLNPSPSTPAMNLGSLVHAFVLEPKTADTVYAVQPKFNNRTKDGKAERQAWEEAHAGLIWTNEDELLKARMMAESVLNHPTASILLQDTINESSVYGWYKKRDDNDERDYKQLIKVRPDALSTSHPMLLDLKTTEDATYTGFQKSIDKFKYHLSAAMYLNVVNNCPAIFDETKYLYKHFVLIAVSKTPAFCCETKKTVYNTAVYPLSAETLNMGNVLYRTAMRRLHDANKDNHPGLSEEFTEMDLPPWGKNIPAI